MAGISKCHRFLLVGLCFHNPGFVQGKSKGLAIPYHTPNKVGNVVFISWVLWGIITCGGDTALNELGLTKKGSTLLGVGGTRKEL